jgi:hypothetical protein
MTAGTHSPDVGGGMAAGTMCVIAGPAAAAAILGYLMYRLALWLTSSAPPAGAVRAAPSHG